MSTQVKVISLYSFKGGAGRTVCTANLVGLLAQELGASDGSHLLLMDMDLDSAGLTLLLDQDEFFRGKPFNSSKIVSGQLNLNVRPQRQKFFSEGMIDVSDRVVAPPGSVKFIGAEEVERGGTNALLDKAKDYMRDFKKKCASNGISTIVLDSASGRQESAVVCHAVSDVVIYCCRLTDQFLTGTSQVLKLFLQEGQKLDSRVPAIIILPVAVPPINDNWKGRFDNAMTRLQGLANDIRSQTHVYLFEKGVGEVESFKWVESVLQEKRERQPLTRDEESAVETYRALAKKVREMVEK